MHKQFQSASSGGALAVREKGKHMRTLLEQEAALAEAEAPRDSPQQHYGATQNNLDDEEIGRLILEEHEQAEGGSNGNFFFFFFFLPSSRCSPSQINVVERTRVSMKSPTVPSEERRRMKRRRQALRGCFSTSTQAVCLLARFARAPTHRRRVGRQTS